MAAVINTNMASLNTQRNLSMSQSSLNTSIQRLSSGLRVNSAKDDAAGMAIGERMTSQIRGLNQAVRNANDGISLAQTAEGALSTITDNLQRIRELAVQSSNATNSASDRAALNTEAQQLKDEINRVAANTSFNGVNLLDGSFTAQTFQVGANAGQVISISSIANAQTNALGSSASVTGTAPTAPTTALTAGTDSIKINDASGNAVEIVTSDLAATTSAADRTTQIRDAINSKSAQTGVAASLDPTGKLVLSSSHDITIALAGAAATTANTGLTAGTTAATAGFASLDISTAAGATAAIQSMDSALTAVNTARSTLGAYQNRFSSVVTNLQTNSENLSAARSRILDADFAAETANLTRGQILQQAGTAMLAQANSLPNGVLALLRG